VWWKEISWTLWAHKQYESNSDVINNSDKLPFDSHIWQQQMTTEATNSCIQIAVFCNTTPFILVKSYEHSIYLNRTAWRHIPSNLSHLELFNISTFSAPLVFKWNLELQVLRTGSAPSSDKTVPKKPHISARGTKIFWTPLSPHRNVFLYLKHGTTDKAQTVTNRMYRCQNPKYFY
jgi:hypothetical protein